MNDLTFPTQRLDKWLWCARFFKSRNLAGKLLGANRLRMSGKVVSKAHQKVRTGDVLTFPQGSVIRVVKVLHLAERRGPAPEAQLLYEDLAPVEPPSPSPPPPSPRPRGGGRPTKEDRRAVDRLMGRT